MESKQKHKILPIILLKKTCIDRKSILNTRSAPIDALQSYCVDRPTPSNPPSRLFTFKHNVQNL